MLVLGGLILGPLGAIWARPAIHNSIPENKVLWKGLEGPMKNKNQLVGEISVQKTIVGEIRNHW